MPFKEPGRKVAKVFYFFFLFLSVATVARGFAISPGDRNITAYQHTIMKCYMTEPSFQGLFFLEIEDKNIAMAFWLDINK
jgi:hypothetical protein